ncbi:efflux RND transporter periplasmic adaptor subunit [Belliella kenyensis]|uniref:Efflux RND transporter periplasmic adaptor subunit n=1 Tax=Belliella kenyensis TaxID=1472724 RepID=A0ABV8EP02_9BACT|nr:efflux RND transporter periplasmic adaptor subunit [Belliella kenyensis]MCH7400454.1 efflux RND transporter periplasmic adaptor subunit [Belliella kenyensis]MDN3604530.1 efflux RND transporter periplasmic adaptor subunit [Belliella kenyensis]
MKLSSKFLILPIAMLVIACGGNDELAQKKSELEEKRKEVATLNSEIEALEKEIAKLDPEFGKTVRKSVLITTTTPSKENFRHFIELTGAVLSKKNVAISGEVSGRIQEVRAVEGMRVNKGDVLATIDSESVERNMDEVQKQLELATIVFEKQERLWKQEIGTEIQYLEAKNRKETLEKNLSGIKTQLDRTKVRAPFTGTIETVNVRLGELVQPGTPMFQFVGESDLFIEADVSERYVGIVGKGDSVEIAFPSIKQTLKSKVSSVGSVINPNNRTFKVEVFLPRMENVKPNMISIVKINDYEKDNAITVPNYLILQDSKGDYVFVVENEQSKKRYITRGMTYKEITEVKEGLNGSEVLVDKGFREVGDNFTVKITE